MNLNAFSGRDRQVCRTLLEMMRRENVGVDEALELVSSPIEAAPHQQDNTSDRCPSCGKAKMVSAKGVTEPVLVCPACRYSEYSEVM